MFDMDAAGAVDVNGFEGEDTGDDGGDDEYEYDFYCYNYGYCRHLRKASQEEETGRYSH